jgi:transposase
MDAYSLDLRQKILQA